MNKLLSIFALFSLSITYQANCQQWTVKQPMPTPRLVPACAVYNNMIYVIGGSNLSGITTKNERYDPVTNTWTVMAPMQTARVELEAATVNGKIYAIGGYVGGVATNVVEEYNPATDTWAAKAPMPTARSVFSVGVINDKIYAVGGWPGQYSTLEVYTPATNTWVTKAHLPSGVLQNSGCAVINDKLYLVGGRTYPGVVLDSVYVYDPASDTWTNTNNNLPQKLFSGSALAINNKINYFAGRTTDCQSCWTNNTTTHYVYDPATHVWSIASTMLSARSAITAAYVLGKVYVLGGADAAGQPAATNEEYAVPQSATGPFPDPFVSQTTYETPGGSVSPTDVLTLVTGEDIIVAPNPAISQFSISALEKIYGEKTIVIVNSLGAKVCTLTTSENRVEVSTAGMAAGMYFVHIAGRDHQFVKKVMVTK